MSLLGCSRENGKSLIIDRPITLLVSMDGFRYDYLGRTQTPNFDRFAQEGVVADALIPVFPTKTFPNHYTIVTGLYPDEHGIIANRMIDTIFDQTFRIGANSTTTRDGRWFEGEPIWVTAEKQGIRSATFFWPGSDAEIQGKRPTLRKVYDNSIDYADRISQVLDWIALPDTDRPAFISLYFESPDKEGHLYGPEADEVTVMIEAMDRHLGNLIAGLEAMGVLDQINLVLLSDHGMTQLSRQRVIFLDDYIDLDHVQIVNCHQKQTSFQNQIHI